jgi:DNA polymerase III delta subunit
VAGVKSIVLVTGRDPGPGERALMLEAAERALGQLGVEDHVRVDVPGRGASAGDDDGTLRVEVQAVVPALQSGSLFGGKQGVLVVDAQNLLKAEATVIAELLGAIDPDQAAAVFVAAGRVPAPLGTALTKTAEKIEIRRLREDQAGTWLAAAARDRGVRLDGDTVGAFVQRFGTDVASMSQALDQLVAGGGEISAGVVRTRFANRPDEPIWNYLDAVADGETGDALRRLADFLLHGHPLQLLAAVEKDLRWRCLASAAPDQATFAGQVGADPKSYPVRKVWDRRSRAKAADLKQALEVVARIDLALKSEPEATHTLYLERMTVALSRWYGGRRGR